MRAKTTRTATIGMLGFDEANALDVTGRSKAFSNANDLALQAGASTSRTSSR